MKVLITGASGLIGGRLIRYLLGIDDVQIRAASRSPRGWPPRVEGCILVADDPSSHSAACLGVNAVINLAAMPEGECARDPQRALRVNAGGALALTSAAVSAGVDRFVQLSTSKVYGDNLTGRVTEQTLPQPRSHYAITHRAAEDYAARHESRIVFRLANGFGAPDDARSTGWDVIVNAMCRQAVVEQRIAIRSSGHEWRNFITLNDIVRALYLAVSDLPEGTYNLGGLSSMRIREVADRVAAACASAFGFTPEITTGRAEGVMESVPLDYCIDKLLAAGFRPSTTLDDELRRTLLAARKNAELSGLAG